MIAYILGLVTLPTLICAILGAFFGYQYIKKIMLMRKLKAEGLIK